jgi:hypothetical protein
MRRQLLVVTIFVAITSTTAFAQCESNKKLEDMSQTEVASYYNCIRPQLIAGYQSQGDDLAMAYSSWQATAKQPAKPGFHSNRLLMTYVNDVGIDTYLTYAIGLDMPLGSLIAKESYEIKGSGKLKEGPLFFMEKVGVDKAPETAGWYYSALKDNGKPMSVKQSFCHSCHMAYAAQDYLGFPQPEVRLK